jgi:hypothetical protein
LYRGIIQIAFILIVIWSLAYYSYYAGTKAPDKWEEFQIIPPSQNSGRQEVVVLRIYGDYLITAPFDETTKEIERKLYILKLDEISDMPLIYKKFGGLKPKDEAS